jgi:hypothetical protein
MGSPFSRTIRGREDPESAGFQPASQGILPCAVG